ncbi:OmpA family protein [Paraburkholderia sediminicola]|uniref:OmpA family protein n=1 Tax=Paraburkholderia sediminicola TaxID=458836 RepID=UPI0038BDA741
MQNHSLSSLRLLFLCVFGGILASACATQSGPTYTAHAIVAATGQQARTYQVTCSGLFESSQSCLSAAREICHDQAVTPLEYVDGLREGVRTNNSREMTFKCDKRAEPAAAPWQQSQVQSQPQAQPVHQMLLQGDANFAIDSAALSDAAKTGLDDFVRANNDVRLHRVTVTGYTDSSGSREHNQELSEARAKAVALYLRSHSVNTRELVVQGSGPENPVASNATAEGRALNRRVEVKGIGQ